jgi:hypothetical protein
MSNYCKNLKILNLSCEKFTDHGIIAIIKKCLELEDLNISDNENITDLSLIEISNNCKNLKTFHIDNCDAITDNGVIAVTKKCLNLEDLDISDNENISDLSLFEISRNCTKHLKVLRLEKFYKVNVNGIIAISKSCLNLKDIFISNNEIATDLRLIEIAKNNKKLKINLVL